MFNFDLQALLDARQVEEEKKQMAFAEAMREVSAQKAVLEDIRQKRMAMTREFYTLEGKPVDSLKPAMYTGNIAMYRQMETDQEERCRKAEQEAEDKRLLLIEAAKQKKMLEKLKEKKFEEYRQALNMKENKELDESSILRYGGPSS
jgi:flagellar protein FliJ